MPKQRIIRVAVTTAVLIGGSLGAFAGVRPTPERADASPTVRSATHIAHKGRVSISFDPATLEAYGWTLSAVGKGGLANGESTGNFMIQPKPVPEADIVIDRRDGMRTGSIRSRGAILLSNADGRVTIANPVIGLSGDSAWTVISALGGNDEAVTFEITTVTAEYDGSDGVLRLLGSLTITEPLALALGAPETAGLVVGSLRLEATMVATDEATSLDKPGALSGVDRGLGSTAVVVGPDIVIADLQNVQRFGRVGDITAYAVGTNACNVGDERAQWISYTNEHPVISQGMFRLKDGRFEQIGLSWMKHGFYAVSLSLCGTCTDYTDGTELGVGCSDPYSASLNGAQNNMSMRSDLNAHTGYFPYPWSAPPYEPTIGRRLLVRDADLEPSLNKGATYFVDGHYVAADDAAAGNANNNASYRRVVVNSPSAGAYNVLPTDATQREQAAIRAWQDTDAAVEEKEFQVSNDGLFILAAKVTDVGGGLWHYEYALQNLNSDRSAAWFSVPTSLGASVVNIGFRNVDDHSGEIYDNTDWPGVYAFDSVTWSTSDFGVDPYANALRWGELYNFRFDCDAPPGDVPVMIGLFKPGTPGDFSITIVGPAGPPPVCGDGLVERDEACDPPDGIHCDDNCQWICGDGVVQVGEECDPPDGVLCDAACLVIYVCGDGVVDPREECDPPNGVTCDANCRRIPTCGDGIVDPGEQCDPPQTGLCGQDCQFESNDDCSSALPVCAGEYTGSTVNATVDGSASCGVSSGSPDAWYTYTPGWSGPATIQTCGSSYDTALSIHTGCPGTTNNEIACNDDRCVRQSLIDLDVVAGQTYLIRVSGYWGATGDYRLTVTGPDCECYSDSDCVDSGRPCTKQVCLDTACVDINVEGVCDDGDACTTADACADGFCVGGPPPSCDSVACTDCNGNGARDDCEGLPDCDGNGIPDECEFADCNGNGIADVCDIAAGQSTDCDGGPVGSVVDGDALYAPNCLGCHGPGGGGGFAPDIRDRGRASLWSRLLAPTNHVGGTNSEFTQQDFADMEAFLATAGSGGRPDRVPDACQVLVDCDRDSQSDACELASGTQFDLDYSGIPDACENCFASSPPTHDLIPDAVGELVASTKNRVISFSAGDPGRSQAVQVLFASLPPPFDIWNGHYLWVSAPVPISEHGISVNPPPGAPSFMAASLQCEPYYTDWTAYPVVHLFHEGIVPSGSYEIAVLDEACSVNLVSRFSSPLEVTTSAWGDTVASCETTPCPPPDGSVDMPDVIALIQRFVSSPDAIIKARADLEPGCLDLVINISDVLYALTGFQGLAYPFTPSASDPCDSTCLSPFPVENVGPRRKPLQARTLTRLQLGSR